MATTSKQTAAATKKSAEKRTAAKAKAAPEAVCQCNANPVTDQPGVHESCGRLTRGRFAPGHDAKLKGVLIKATADGTQYKVLAQGKVTSRDPQAVASELGWSKYTDRALEIKAEKAAKAEATAKAKAAAKAEAQANPPSKAKAEAAKATPAAKAPRSRKATVAA